MVKNLNDLGFKFEIGEIVVHRLQLRDKFASSSISFEKNKKKTLLLILERAAIECSGGVQYEYRVRVGLEDTVSTFDPQKIYNINEIEIEKHK